MNHLLHNTVLASALAAVVLTAGCASSSDMDKLRADIAANRDAAARAQATADAATGTAHSAEVTAREASEAADAANARVDRMFKKAMYK